MPTARDKLLQISMLSQGNTAGEHLLSAGVGGGSVTVQVFDEIDVEIMAENIIILDEGYHASVEDDLEVILDDDHFEIEVC